MEIDLIAQDVTEYNGKPYFTLGKMLTSMYYKCVIKGFIPDAMDITIALPLTLWLSDSISDYPELHNFVPMKGKKVMYSLQKICNANAQSDIEFVASGQKISRIIQNKNKTGIKIKVQKDNHNNFETLIVTLLRNPKLGYIECLLPYIDYMPTQPDELAIFEIESSSFENFLDMCKILNFTRISEVSNEKA